jgi:hypothetical protein
MVQGGLREEETDAHPETRFTKEAAMKRFLLRAIYVTTISLSAALLIPVNVTMCLPVIPGR